MPRSLDAMAALLGEAPAAYRGTAAVTTGRTGGGAADRVVVNPEAYRELGDFGRDFVLAHETAHVATRDATTAATPRWLSEGLADRIAYRGTGRTAAEGRPNWPGRCARGTGRRGSRPTPTSPSAATPPWWRAPTAAPGWPAN